MAWIAESGGEVAAMMPGVEFGRGPLARFMSMPDGCYGQIFFNGEPASDRGRLKKMLLDSIVRRRYVKTFLFDYYGVVPRDPRFETVLCATHLVDISDPHWLPPDRKLVSQIRKAEREGVSIEPLNWNRHRRRFMSLVHVTERRHRQKPVYDDKFFRALAALAAHDDRVIWVWCEHEGNPVSSHIYFIENGVLQGWQKYLDRRYSFLKADQYIRFTTCREMARRGITRLNLGATPKGAVGLARYKRRWGGEPVYYNCYVKKRGLGNFV